MNNPAVRPEIDRRDFFDGIASVWDRDHCPNGDQIRLQGIVGRFPLGAGDRVLDAGCGTGRIYSILRDLVGRSGQVVELDFSRGMLGFGREKHGADGACFLQADVAELPFPDRSFDAVVAFALFPHIGDKRKALTQFRRILDPGSFLFILHLMGREKMNELHAGVQGVVRADRIPSRERMEQLFRESGFASWSIEDRPDLYLAAARV